MKTALSLIALVVSLSTTPAMAQDGPSTLLPLKAKQWTPAMTRHLLNRAGFGGTPEEVAYFHGLGLKGAVEKLLQPIVEDTDTPFEAELDPRIPRDQIRRLSEEERRKLRRARRRKDQNQFRELTKWWFEQLITTSHPLREKMTLFWHGHFTSGQKDVRNSYHLHLQNELFRTNALGSYRTLVHAVAKDPAMLEYLDCKQNLARRPNENFARELMELFTMGVGNYTEDDIKEAARAFTGWNFNGTAQFFVNRRQHDRGTKVVFGKEGRFEGEDIIDMILDQDVTARYMAGKMFHFFCHDHPSGVQIDNLAKTLRGDGSYNVAPFLTKLFMSRAFYSSDAVGTQIKSPVQLTVAAIRQLNLDPKTTAPLAAYMSAQMGQQLFEPPNVKGWDGGRAWISTSSLFVRYNFAGMITRDISSQTVQAVEPEMMEIMEEMESMEPMMETPASPAPGKGAARRRNRGSPLRAGVRLNFKFPATKLIRDRNLKTADEVVSYFSEHCLSVPLPDETRLELLSHLNHDLIGDESPFVADRWDASRRVKGMLHLFFSTPEYQMN